MYCISFHLFLAYRSLWSKSSDGIIGFPFNITMWFGVSASRSFGSSETFVMGLSFRIASTSHKMVWSPSSSRICCFRTEVRTIFTERIRHSQTQPWWEAAGMLKLQFMPSLTKALWILPWFKSARLSFSSQFAPTKFVMLSEMIDETGPPLQINLCTAFIEESASSVYVTSKCTARLVKQVKSTPYLLRWLLPLLTSIGPACHLLVTRLSFVALTNNTVRYYLPGRRVCTDYPVLLP